MTDTPTTAPAAAAPASSEQIQIGSPGLTAEQARTLYADGVARGLISREQADKELTGTGNKPLDAPAQPDPSLTEEGAALDAQLPAARAGEFTIPPIADATPQQMLEIATTSRGWLEAGQFPKEIGSYIAKRANAVAKRYAGMSPAEREADAVVARSRLAKMWGDKTADNIEMAKRLVREIEAKKPGLVKFLDDSGAANDPLVIANIFNHASRLATRRK